MDAGKLTMHQYYSYSIRILRTVRRMQLNAVPTASSIAWDRKEAKLFELPDMGVE